MGPEPPGMLLLVPFHRRALPLQEPPWAALHPWRTMRALIAAVLAAVALAMPTDAQTGFATVDLEDQTSDGTTVIVASTTMTDGGFITIHDASLQDGDALGSVVGWSAYLGPGPHTDVEVQVEGIGTGELTLIAMPHFDSNGNETFDFVTSEGDHDGPYTDADGAVTDNATVTVEGPAANETDDREGRENGTGPADDEDASAFGVVAVLAMLAIAVARRR